MSALAGTLLVPDDVWPAIAKMVLIIRREMSTAKPFLNMLSLEGGFLIPQKPFRPYVTRLCKCLLHFCHEVTTSRDGSSSYSDTRLDLKALGTRNNNATKANARYK